MIGNKNKAGYTSDTLPRFEAVASITSELGCTFVEGAHRLMNQQSQEFNPVKPQQESNTGLSVVESQVTQMSTQLARGMAAAVYVGAAQQLPHQLMSIFDDPELGGAVQDAFSNVQVLMDNATYKMVSEAATVNFLNVSTDFTPLVLTSSVEE